MRALSLTSFFGLGELAPERRRALTLVFSTSVALVMGVNFIQPALPALTQPFGISDAALGLVMTMLTAPAIFLAPVFGAVADLFGRRLLLAWGLILYGIFGAAMALAPTFTWLLFFRAIQGVAYSAVIPLTIVLIGDLLEGDKEIGGQGLKVFLDRVGYFVLPPIGGLLATIAWYWPFTCYFLTVPLGIAAFFWMPETKGQRTNGAKGYLGRRYASHPPSAAPHRFFSRLFEIFSGLRVPDLLPALPRAHPRGVDRDRGTPLHLFFRRRHDHVEPGGAVGGRARQNAFTIRRFSD